MKPETEHSKEILRWAREKYASAPESEKANWEYMFPELKESEDEDEKIRKSIVKFVELEKGVNLPPEDADKMLAYLERQKEQKPAELPKDEDYGINGLYAAVDILQTILSAVKELYKQQNAKWTEEDEKYLRDSHKLLKNL